MKYRNKRNNLHSIFARMKHSKGILGESVRTFFVLSKNTVISKDIKAKRKSIPVKKPWLERRNSACLFLYQEDSKDKNTNINGKNKIKCC